MTVFVDDMFLRADVPNGHRTVRGSWCHMFSDSLDPTELHELARRVGMLEKWFQHKPRAPWQDHYDVTKTKRAAAVAAGAVEVTTRQMVEIGRVKRCQHLGVDPEEDQARREREAREWRIAHGLPADGLRAVEPEQPALFPAEEGR